MFTTEQFKLKSAENVTNEDIIQQEISNDLISEFKLNANDGQLYYIRKNTYIANIEKDRKNNLWATNHKCGSGFFKKIVDQKINYLLGKKVIVNNAENCNKIFDINNIIKKAAKEASKKGVSWLHAYIDNNGDLQIKIIDALECIPIYDTEYEDELIQMIRYYNMHVIVNNEKKIRKKVELWDKEKVTFYMEDDEGNYYFDYQVEENPRYNYRVNTTLSDNIKSTEYFGWGKVPFVALWNNDDKINDLIAIKQDIDLYDVMKSDFGNNIDRFQDSILTVYGYSAESYEKFLNNFKRHGVAEIDEKGSLNWLTLDIPIEARKTFLEIIRDDIFEFGQAVDTRRAADSNTTNVVIKSRYADLDLKADDLEAEVTMAIKKVYWFINKFLEIKKMQQDNIDEIDIVYNRNIIFNTTQMIDDVLKSVDVTSKKTALANHPFVNDADEELKLIAKDKKEEEKNIDNADPNGIMISK